jgi:hypothetical protein
MVFSLARFKKCFLKMPALTQRFAWAFIFMHLINFGFNQTMISLQEMRMQEKSDNFIPLMFAVAFVGFLIQSLFKVVWTLLICYHFHHNQTPLIPFLKKYTELGLIESLRAFFRAVLWGVPLVIPGFIKMIRYQFVLYVVASSKKYEQGNIDALEASENITRGSFWSLTFLVLFFAAMAFSLNATESFFQAPVEVFITEFLGFFFISFQGMYLLFLFQDLMHKRGHE